MVECLHTLKTRFNKVSENILSNVLKILLNQIKTLKKFKLDPAYCWFEKLNKRSKASQSAFINLFMMVMLHGCFR